MAILRKTSLVLLFCQALNPLMGGTGRPDDGFLSFILLLGFLLILLGILQIAACLKRKIDEILDGLY